MEVFSIFSFFVFFSLLLLLLLTPPPHPKKQAYFFALVEHLITSSVRLGLSESQATRLATQTCFGAGKMLVESTSAGKESPAQLRKNVTSPNGTTQAALESFEVSGLAEIVDRAVQAAADRGEELGRTLGGAVDGFGFFGGDRGLRMGWKGKGGQGGGEAPMCQKKVSCW